MTSPPTGNAALRDAIARLRDAGLDDPARDARRLIAHALLVTPDRLTLILPDPMPPAALTRLAAAIAARAARQPVAQITGSRLFWGRRFAVTRDTLDPRPETEALIAEALGHEWRSVLDLGTGTGAILLTLLAERPAARGLGTDLSPAALSVARGNAQSLGIAADFIAADWFSGVEGRFDLIVSNPPYIAADEMPDLAPDVRDWEPHLALTDGADGLTAYRAIAAGAAAHLTPGGRVLVEIGAAQGRDVVDLFVAEGFAAQILPDLDGRDRVVSAQICA